MNLLVVLITLTLRQLELGLEPAAVVSGLTRRWRDIWLARGGREGWRGGVVLAFVVVPPVMVIAAVTIVLSGVWHSLLLNVVALLVMLIVLLDRERPDVFKREQQGWMAADERSADSLAQVDMLALEAGADAELARARRALLLEQLRELFAPLFWFLLGGPVVAFAYYFLRLLADTRTPPAAVVAQRLLYYAEWPVARVLALSFALAGDFVATWQNWRHRALDAGIEALDLLDESTTTAQPVDLRMNPDTLPGPILVTALSAIAALLHRALVIWIVLLALHTLWP